MDHLTYQQTNNKVFKTYYDRFKKMVKQDLNGDGWFLLVKDFPFKDGDNIMFTAGEDIGKWNDKNLVSLYGKMNYIIGRCRKRGPVLTLLHFQEGDYVKQATESGLRKELKEYFKGTGVSVRVFKSLKVSEQEPEVEEESTESPVEIQDRPERSGQDGTEEPLIPELPTPTEKRKFIMKIGAEIPKRALACGLSEEAEYKKVWINLNRLVRLGKVDDSLEQVEILLGMLREHEGTGSEEGNTASRVLELEQELSQIKVAEGNIRRELQKNVTELASVLQQGAQHQLKKQLELIEVSEQKLTDLINTQTKRRREIEDELLAIS